MNYRQFLTEAIRQVSETERIVEAGTPLYHGTSSKFALNKLRPGGYDSMIWTTTHDSIAKTYIPVGHGTHTSSRALSAPPADDYMAALQRSIGIDYDLAEIDKDAYGRVQSFVEAPVFSKHPLGNKLEEVRDRYRTFQQTFQDFRHQYTNDPDSFNPRLGDLKAEYIRGEKKSLDIMREWNRLFSEKKSVEDDYFQHYDPERIRYRIVNELLEKLGYKPVDGEQPDYNNSWNLFTTHEGGWRILPNETRVVGRLLTIKPKRDLRLLDFTLGGEIEGDLMNVDYHRIPEFRRAAKQGYDGVVINDFAQSNNYGNVGHISYGLFKHVVEDLVITEAPATHDDLDFYK